MCRETERFEQMMERLLDRELQEYEEELFEEEDDDDAMTRYDNWYQEQKDKEACIKK